MPIIEVPTHESMILYEILRNPVLYGEFIHNFDHTERETEFEYTDYQKEILCDMNSYISLCCARSIGKCVHEDSMILNPETGEYRTAKYWFTSKRLNTIPSIDQDNWKQEVSPCVIYDNGIQDCYELITSKGLKTIVTDEHPMLTNTGFILAKNLVVGDYLAGARDISLFGSIERPEQEYLTLAHFIAEGTYHAGSITTTDNEVVADLRDIAAYFNCTLTLRDNITYFFTTNYKEGHGKGSGIVGIRNDYLDFLKTHELKECHSFDKFVPQIIFMSTKKRIGLFLNRLFGDDGWCTDDELGYATTSERLARDLQHLLLRFGIFTSLSFKRNKCLGAWQLSIKGKNNISIFLRDIGVSIERKFKKLHEFNERYNNHNIHNQADVLPIANYTKYLVYDSKNNRYRKLNYFPSRIKANRITNKDVELNKFIDADINWIKIKSIRKIKNQQTYAISVDNNTHLIDNLWSHNTVCLSDLMAWVLTLNIFPEDYIVYTVPGKAHIEPVFNALVRLFRTNTFLKNFISPNSGVNNSDYTVKLLNQATLLCRIAGQSGSGIAVIGLHSPYEMCDEGGYYPFATFTEFQPTHNTWTQGHKMYVSGVPTGLREKNVLYHVDQENSNFSKHRVSAYQNPRFTEEDEHRAIAQYGGKDSDDFTHLILGLHGKPIFSLFDRSLMEIADYPMYKLELDGIRMQDNISLYIEKLSLLPAIIDKSTVVFFGIDLGYTEPSCIYVLYLDNYGRIKFHAKIKLIKVSYPIQEKFIDYLDSKFNPRFIGMDEGAAGKSVKQHLLEDTEYVHKNYIKRLVAIDFSSQIVLGIDSSGEEIKSKTKPFATSVLQDYSNSHKIVFTTKDLETVTELERMTYMKTQSGEIVYKTLTDRGGKRGDDHFTAALLCAGMAYYLNYETLDFSSKKVKLFRGGWFL